MIFEGTCTSLSMIYSLIMRWLPMGSLDAHQTRDFSIRNAPHQIALPAIFFDGAQQGGICGCGFWLKLSNDVRYHICRFGGSLTNNSVELMDLWSGLWMACHLEIKEANIYGDSKIIIDGLSGNGDIFIQGALGWCNRLKYLI